MIRMMLRAGRVTEPAPAPPESPQPLPPAAHALRGSLQVRHVDAGSCNGCEMEIVSAFGPTYDAEQYGVRLVASPRHADALLVTGAVTRNMAGPLRKTWEATPAPKLVIALGDCARDCGAFRGGHGIQGAVGDILPVDTEIPGCPPEPGAIIEGLRRLVQR